MKKIFKSELGKGAFILFVTMGIFFFLNFVFHFTMGRILGPAGYGILATLMSLVYLYGAPTEAIQNVVTRYTANLNLKKENGKIKFLLLKSLKRGFIISTALFLIAIIPSMYAASLLKIDLGLIILTNAFLFSSFSLPVVRGVLQGRKKFTALGIGMMVESVLKLTSAIFLVMIGWQVFGAMIGVIIGVLASFILSFYMNSGILRENKEKIEFDNIYSKSVPYFVSMFVILLMLSMDIIFVRWLFSSNPEVVGSYAVLSMMGKMIFFGTMAIGKAMFPLTSEKYDNNKEKDGSKLFRKSFFVVLLICLISIMVYTIFPKFLINLFYGGQYTGVANLLKYSGISLSFLSLTNLVVIYGLSTNRLKRSYFMLFYFIITLVLLYFFHSSLIEYMLAFMVSNIIMFIGVLFLVKK